MKRTSLLVCIACLSMCIVSCRDRRGLAVGKIKSASQLATMEFVVDKVVFGVKRKKLLWAINLNDAKFVAHSQAIIKAGINLEKLQRKHVKIEGTKISLTLPPVEVINFSYPAESFQKDTLISGNAFMNTINLADQEQFFQDAETDIRNSLKYMDIVPLTEQKTARLLETLLLSLGYEEIYIDFEKGPLISEIAPNE